MKKTLLVLLTLLCSVMMAQAQDVIVKKDGSTIVCRVVETTNSSVFYQAWSNPNGPIQIVKMTEVANINYEKGKQEQVQPVKNNQYIPYNQNTGAAQYNDNALIAIHNVQQVPEMLKKANKYKWIGIIGGGTLTVAGLVLGILSEKNLGSSDGQKNYVSLIDHWYGPTLIGVGAGAIFSGVFLWKSNQIKKKAEEISRYSLFENEFNFNNGTSLSAGIDLIKDKQFKTNTVGIGLRYNF